MVSIWSLTFRLRWAADHHGYCFHVWQYLHHQFLLFPAGWCVSIDLSSPSSLAHLNSCFNHEQYRDLFSITFQTFCKLTTSWLKPLDCLFCIVQWFYHPHLWSHTNLLHVVNVASQGKLVFLCSSLQVICLTAG